MELSLMLSLYNLFNGNQIRGNRTGYEPHNQYVQNTDIRFPSISEARKGHGQERIITPALHCS